MKNPRDIIKRPVITERTADMMADKKYVFEVDIRANKVEIKQAIEQIFKVKVTKVNTLRMPAKPKRYGRYNGYTSEWKKAFVTLSEDSKELEFFESV
ncbi:50S ribosomal protein L23 [Paenibacillus larvae]|jgi:large subunit ribosomal protein L23|uniref:Large ribosomal subunit protein uL23 n=4 Tax=Paenibacillus larvae TaxID=1464 RepID=V9WBG5_9BACL|nr:50S ribosomal protein L23 [Paenibacillus larvae]AHD07538.1 50S ribosomal protein L23 [Paenibacillus larvae subsp. larvae DSM 25430]AQR78517.1 50S ribosomal protein L23 [Paenibacillus larvae subsp. larvae]AQT84794.1 50S ribosomal protein L23 [Paenibacillus larvae subsp. pulvifaciens]AQZ46788.1 50S ribosomal protein L23 [Paenibacillus larvae subsp. pulvifaciens]ARF68183.1 50S ribosomal protein L23 [Paenibacillus larvae subsp. pulvifaciens]